MKTENKNVYILSCEAKDLYDSNNYITPNKIGYNIRRKDGQINFKKFKNSLDYSIEKIELGKIYKKQIRNKKFSFVYKGKQYSQQVINVNFSYSYNIFNKTFKGVYVKAGYYYGDLEFNDCICIKDNQLIGIEIKKEVENPIEESLLEGYFKVVEIEDKNGIHYEYDKVKDFEVIKNPTELRKYLYENGFYCDGIKYVRYKRSAGSSRVGKCLFVNEVLYDRIHKYELCGLNIKYGDEIDLAAFEAYIALTTSSIIDTITIKPENILLIPDFESSFNDNVVKVTYENNQLETKVENTTINNSLFDGQSLLDSSFFEKYDNKGMLLLRNRFFKSACFNTNIQEFFKDNDIKFVWQLKGKTLANNIEDIKLITTPSSIKYLKFGKFNDWLKNIDETFGVVKHEKPTHYFGGRLVSTHYQLINTLQLNEKEIDLVLNDSFNYIKAINNDLATLKYHIHYPTPSEKISSMKTKNDIVFKLLGLNEDFSKTKIFKEFKDSLIKSLIKEIRQGHILVNGNYSTLFGNGYEMLQHSIGKFDGCSIIEKGCISTKRFEYNKFLLGSRSPHIVSGNILIAKNIHNDLIDKYFNLSNEIVYINAINTNILQRLNGCDYDSDTLLLTDNKILVEKAMENYNKFKVPTCFVQAEKTKRFYTNEDKADLDTKTSVNKIGEIINFSQYLNSIMWDKILKDGESIEDNLDIYYDACKLAVLSGIEIDRSKKEFLVNTKNEIDTLKSKYQIIESDRIVKPVFFKNITMDNGYKLNKNHKYVYFDTPMDYIQKSIKRLKKELKNDSIANVNFSEIVKKPSENPTRTDYRKKNSVIDKIIETKNEILKLFTQNATDGSSIYDKYNSLKEECVNYINFTANTENSVYLLLKVLEDKQYRNIHSLLSFSLFGCPNEIFFNMILENRGKNEILIEDSNGDISFYGFNFIKKSI